MLLRPIFLLLLIIFCACSPGRQQDFKQTSGKIIGGVRAQDGQFPNVVALTSEGKIQCTSSIISPYHLVTAAHCLIDLKSLMQAASAFLVSEKIQLLGVEERKMLAEEIFYFIVKERLNSLQVYFGEGSEGGRVEGKKIQFKELKINSRYLNHHLRNFLLFTQVTEPSGQEKLSPSDDIAMIEVKSPFDVVAVPMLTAQEIQDNLAKLDQKTGLLVGYGWQLNVVKEIDPLDALERSEGKSLRILLEGHWKKLGVDKKLGRLIHFEDFQETLELLPYSAQANILLKYFNYKLAQAVLAEKQKNYGVKNLAQASISLRNFFEAQVIEVLRTKNEEGIACRGDSGGPVFIELMGELRQLGVVSTGRCEDKAIYTVWNEERTEHVPLDLDDQLVERFYELDFPIMAILGRDT